MVNYSYPIELPSGDKLGIGIGVGFEGYGMKPTWVTPDQSATVDNSLPSGYSFSYWQKKSPLPVSTISASQPFTQELADAITVSNTTITEIDLVFSYTAPVTSQTFTYSGGNTSYSSYSASGGSSGSSSGGTYQAFG